MIDLTEESFYKSLNIDPVRANELGFIIPKDTIYIVPYKEREEEKKNRPLRVHFDYGQCPKCGEDLISEGRYALWDEDNNIIDEFDRLYCLNCGDTLFMNGKGKFEFQDEDHKMIYTYGEERIEFDLVKFERAED